MIALDLSRLLSRAGRGTPTGIDRVELAYAEHLIATGTPCCFAALAPDGRLALLPRSIGRGFRPRDRRRLARTARPARAGAAGAPGCAPRPPRAADRKRAAAVGMLRDSPGGSVYLLVSHHHLERRRLIARLKTRSRARFVCLIHDLIPVEFPEYAKPGQAANHLRRIETAAAFADAFIVNSAVTGAALRPHLDRAGRLLAGTGGAVRRRSAGRRGRRRPADRPALFRLCRHDRGAQKSPAAAQSMAPAEPRSRGTGAASWCWSGSAAGKSKTSSTCSTAARRCATPSSSTTPCPTRRWCRCCAARARCCCPPSPRGSGFR